MKDSKLYTGGGDRGYTQTITNKRIPKSDDIINLLGTLDEFSASLGAAKAQSGDETLRHDIEAVQKKMIGIMGEVAGGDPNVTDECVHIIEEMTDRYQPRGLTAFVLPGANIVSAQLDVARTVARRAERIAAKLGTVGRIRPKTLVYLNRLSDLIYAMARWAAEDKKKPAGQLIDSTSATVNGLDLALAKEIALAVERRAAEQGKRVVIAVLDSGANLMLLHAMDDAFIASVQIAQDKAYTAVSLKMPTHVALSESRGGTLDGLSATDNNRLMLLGGGEPLVINGRVAGGIGVSGGTAEEDIAFARFGAMYLERRLSL